MNFDEEQGRNVARWGYTHRIGEMLLTQIKVIMFAWGMAQRRVMMIGNQKPCLADVPSPSQLTLDFR